MKPLVLLPEPTPSTDHVTGRLAVNCCVCKTEIVDVGGETVSTGITCRFVEPVSPWVAEIVVFPPPTRVATLLATVATPVLVEPHVAVPVKFCVRPSE